MINDPEKLKAIADVFEERIEALDPVDPSYRPALRSLKAQRAHLLGKADMHDAVDELPLQTPEEVLAGPFYEVTDWETLEFQQVDLTPMTDEEALEIVDKLEVDDPMLSDRLRFTDDMTAQDKMLRIITQDHMPPDLG